jgi:glutathione S-transferase
MKLYQKAPTPSSRRVTIFSKLIGVELDTVEVEIREGENLRPPFSDMSVNGTVPLLVLDSGECIAESIAICRYLDLAFPNQQNLFGTSAVEQATIEMWQRVVELKGLYVAFQAFRNISKVYEDRENCIEEWGHESKQRVTDFLPELDARLAHSPYLAGDALSVADITAFLMLNVVQGGLKIELGNDLPNLKAYFDKLATIPEFS